MGREAPYHAHVYYSAEQRPDAEMLRGKFLAEPRIRFVGRMSDRPVGPHPIPQFEVHFDEPMRADVIAAIEASGLRALVHPLTDDDMADHTRLAHWLGEPLQLDLSVLDPHGANKGVPRFGKAEF